MEARVSLPAPRTPWGKLRVVLEMIKIEHTLFALPFALMGALLAARGMPTARQMGWILVAMVGARSAAMAFNRLVDREYDGRNPRTKKRALPAGQVSVPFVIGFTLAASALLILAAYMLNPLAALLVTYQRALLRPPVMQGLEPVDIPWSYFGLACVSSSLILLLGFRLFEHYKWEIVERI